MGVVAPLSHLQRSRKLSSLGRWWHRRPANPDEPRCPRDQNAPVHGLAVWSQTALLLLQPTTNTNSVLGFSISSHRLQPDEHQACASWPQFDFRANGQCNALSSRPSGPRLTATQRTFKLHAVCQQRAGADQLVSGCYFIEFDPHRQTCRRLQRLRYSCPGLDPAWWPDWLSDPDAIFGGALLNCANARY